MRYIILLLLILIGSIYSQDLINLTADKKKEYKRKKLSIEKITSFGGGGMTTPIGNTNISSYNVRSNTSYKAYWGFQEISEEKFLRIAGYDAEAKKVRKIMSLRKRKTNRSLIVGVLSFAITYPLIVNGMRIEQEAQDKHEGINDALYESEMAKSNKYLYSTMGLMTIGTGFLFDWLLRLGSTNIKYYSYEIVKDIEEEYNSQLFRKISNQGIRR